MQTEVGADIEGHVVLPHTFSYDRVNLWLVLACAPRDQLCDLPVHGAQIQGDAFDFRPRRDRSKRLEHSGAAAVSENVVPQHPPV